MQEQIEGQTEEKTKPITLLIEKELWREFKIGTSRHTTLNEALVELITREVQRRNKG